MATEPASDHFAASVTRRGVPPTQAQGRCRRRLVAMLTLTAAVACASALAACGSGIGLSGTSTGPGNGASLPFAQCMRANGVPNFPDPLPSGGFARTGNNEQTPASQKALKGCIHILKGGSSRQGPTAAERAAALTYARCMRAHGVPSFPDPVSSPANHNTNVIVQGGLMFPIGSTIDPGSPAFRHADAACGQIPSGTPKGG